MDKNDDENNKEKPEYTWIFTCPNCGSISECSGRQSHWIGRTILCFYCGRVFRVLSKKGDTK